MVRLGLLLSLPVLVLSIGCAPSERSVVDQAAASSRADSLSRARQDSINRTLPGYVVDSILPVEEELRRFRNAVGGKPVIALSRGSRSRVDLITRFVKALERGDSADLSAMLLDPREFADLVYPESPYVRAPYRQPPGLVWTAIQNPSLSGLKRLVRRFGGMPLRYASHVCEGKPDRQGQNLIWTGCVVRLADQSGRLRRHRLFGSIIERKGQFKIVSYVNEF